VKGIVFPFVTDRMHTSRKQRSLGRLAVAGLLVVGSVATLGGVAAAAPAVDKQKQAAEIQDQIEASDLQISALSESLAQAQARQDAAQTSAQAAEAQIAAAKTEVNRILGLVEENLASLYRRTLRGQSVGEMDFSATVDLLKRSQYSQTQASRDSELLDKLDAAQQDLAVQRDNATQARDKAAAEAQQITEAKTAIETARAAQQAVLDKITGELKAAVAAEQARRAQATQAKIAVSAGPEKFIDVGPPNGSAAQAIEYARQAIGSGYSTSPRMGPTYDCSGLTTSAWRAAGVSIPSTSGSQYAALPHVPLNALQPGDLIFWGPGGSDHVGLYIGGGSIIDASSSAHAVTQRGIWGSPVGAARVL
jgi:cell wall-associated NlpC family hydrolase